jgi:hypothetical protein
MEMTNDPLAYIKNHQFKYYSRDRLSLSVARVILHDLEINEDIALLLLPKKNSMTPVELEEAEFKVCAEFLERRYELEILITLFQKERTARSVATKKAKRDLLALVEKKVIAKAKRDAFTPEEVKDRKEARAQRKEEKRLKEALLVSLKPRSIGGK